MKLNSRILRRITLGLGFAGMFAAEVFAGDRYVLCCQQIPPDYPNAGDWLCTNCKAGVGCTLYYNPNDQSYMIRCNDNPP